jgi:hypothetical protein
MYKPMNSVLPFALLAAFALAGCDRSSTADTASEPAVEAEVVAQPEDDSEPEAAANASASDPKAKPVSKAQQMLDQVKAMLQPEVIGPALDKNFASIQEILAGITDETSATESLPDLVKIQQGISRIVMVSGLTPVESKPVIAEKIAAASGPFQAATDKLLENEEIGAIVKSHVNKIINSFEQLKAKFPVEPAEEEESATETEADAETGSKPKTEVAAEESESASAE